MKLSLSAIIISDIEHFCKTSRSFFLQPGKTTLQIFLLMNILMTQNIEFSQKTQCMATTHTPLRLDHLDHIFPSLWSIVQTGDCGDPGDYTHLTPWFVKNSQGEAQNIFGRTEKVLRLSFCDLNLNCVGPCPRVGQAQMGCV